MEDDKKMAQTVTQGSVTNGKAETMPILTGKRLLYHLWDQDQHLKSPEERKLVRELDFGILICATLGWWMEYIDQNNIVNTYVSGMKEDLNLNGNEYTYMLRFFGSATSGFLQAAVHSTLDGRLGLAGWRWMYIICGCMSLPVALSVWWLLPNLPHNTKAWYITEEDKALTLHRSAMQGKVQVTGKLDVALAKPYFAIYLRFSGYSVSQRNVIPACANLVSMVTDFIWSFMSDYTQNRVWWMVGPILRNLSQADVKSEKLTRPPKQMCTTVVSSAILTAWPAVDAARVVAFFLAASGFVTGITWTWANEINVGNAEVRAMTISSMNGLFYATASFLPILISPQTMALKFERGFPSLLAFALCACALILLADFLHKRQLRQEAERNANEIPIEVVGDKGEDGEKAT
ncbi:hypothetical protein S40293_09854 [Stachybotrys chartarum IBT 40293]|nr:hypothetical protein S40293_09854 [Stachybotrys chartarum IBT 40293]